MCSPPALDAGDSDAGLVLDVSIHYKPQVGQRDHLRRIDLTSQNVVESSRQCQDRFDALH